MLFATISNSSTLNDRIAQLTGVSPWSERENWPILKVTNYANVKYMQTNFSGQ